MMDGYDFWSPDEQTARRPRFWPLAVIAVILAALGWTVS